jgi:hypothetical protein
LSRSSAVQPFEQVGFMLGEDTLEGDLNRFDLRSMEVLPLSRKRRSIGWPMSFAAFDVLEQRPPGQLTPLT